MRILKDGDQRQFGGERIVHPSPDRFLIDRDIVAVKDQILAPRHNNIIDVVFPSRQFQHCRSISLRSQFAQSGFDFVKLRLPTDENTLAGQIEIGVLGPRPIALHSNEGVACLFDDEGSDWLAGRELYEHVMDGSGMTIDGEYGKDWWLYYLSDDLLIPQLDVQTLKRKAIGVALKLKDVRWKIREDEKPIDLMGQPNYRAYLDNEVLQELPASEYCPFWIGETRAIVHLQPGFNGIINNAVRVGRSFFFQTHSPLLKGGGLTEWCIRTEFTDLGAGNTGLELIHVEEADYKDMYIFVNLHRDKRLRFNK